MEARSESDLAILGNRLRKVRHAAGMTVRDVAAKVGIDKDTVVRIEAGKPVRESTLLKVLESFGILNLASEFTSGGSIEGKGFAVHMPADDSWYRVRFEGEDSPSPAVGEPGYRKPAERRALAEHKFADQFLRRLRSEIPFSPMKAAVLEVYGPGGWANQLSGTALIYVISGRLRFFHGEEVMEIPAGGSVQFDRTVLHRHEPTVALPSPELPVVILYVQHD